MAAAGAHITADRVFERTDNKPNASTAFNLAGAIDGFQTFVAGIGTTITCFYCAIQVNGQGSPDGAWEIGIGTVTDATPDTLSRFLVSSSTGSLIDWSTATGIDKDPWVFVCSPSGFFNNRGGFGPQGEAARWFGPNTAASFATAVFLSNLSSLLFTVG